MLRITVRLVAFNFFERGLRSINFYFAMRSPFKLVMHGDVSRTRGVEGVSEELKLPLGLVAIYIVALMHNASLDLTKAFN